MSDSATCIDKLKEDDPIPRQNYVCLSFLSPEGIRNCSIRGLKIRGVYDTREEADQRAKELQEVDPNFDVFVGELGKWLPWDPDPNDGAKDQVYYEKELQQLMEGHEDNLKKSKRLQEQRKQDMIKKAATEDHQTTDRNANALDRVRKAYEKKQKEKAIATATGAGTNQPKIEELPKTGTGSTKKKKKNKKNKKKKAVGKLPELPELEELKEQEKIASQERDRLNDMKESIDTHKQNVTSIDDKMARIQSVYKKLKDKEKTT